MGVFSRLKRIWELGGTPSPRDVLEEAVKNGTWPPPAAPLGGVVITEPITGSEQFSELLLKPKGPATIVQDDPLDIFPSDDPDSEQQEGA